MEEKKITIQVKMGEDDVIFTVKNDGMTCETNNKSEKFQMVVAEMLKEIGTYLVSETAKSLRKTAFFKSYEVDN